MDGDQAIAARPTVEKLTPVDWVRSARAVLVKGGIQAVKVDLIATQMNISRGSFYWHFTSRAALLTSLLEHWEAENTAPFEEVATATGISAAGRYEAMARLWLEETRFDPAFDSAVRDWARSSRPVARRVAEIDQRRMQLFETILLEMGYSADEAMIRARVTYYHQIGYYALAMKESRERRRELFPLYMAVLLGHHAT